MYFFKMQMKKQKNGKIFEIFLPVQIMRKVVVVSFVVMHPSA